MMKASHWVIEEIIESLGDADRLPEICNKYGKRFSDDAELKAILCDVVESMTSSCDADIDKIRENLETERARELRDKHRASIVEAIIRDTKADLPQVLVDSELAKMFAEMRSNISSMGIEWQGYLDKAKKTEDDLRLEWRDKAKERVTANLAILEIGRDQGVEVTDEEIAPDLSTLLEQYPDADPDRARAYVNESLYNNKVLEYLEGQSDDDQKK